MGAYCVQNSCAQDMIKWKKLKDMNKKGVYTPEQIEE